MAFLFRRPSGEFNCSLGEVQANQYVSVRFSKQVPFLNEEEARGQKSVAEMIAEPLSARTLRARILAEESRLNIFCEDAANCSTLRRGGAWLVRLLRTATGLVLLLDMTAGLLRLD